MLSRSLSNPPESSCYTVRLDFWLGGFPPRRKSAFVEGSGSPEPEISSMSSGKTGAPFRHGIASSERGRIDDGRIYDFWCSCCTGRKVWVRGAAWDWFLPVGAVGQYSSCRFHGWVDSSVLEALAVESASAAFSRECPARDISGAASGAPARAPKKHISKN